MDETKRDDDPERVGSSHDPDTGGSERNQAGSGDGGGPRLDTPARAGRGGELDGLHTRGVGERWNEPMDGDGGDPVQEPLPGFAAASLSYEGPLPLPAHLQGYEDVQAGFAERIMAMAEASHNASVRARIVPIRAEATALLLSTTAVAFFPWVAFGAAVVLVINGQEVAGIITGLAGAISAGPQIIAATRRPRPAPRPAPSTAPSKSKDKRKKK